MSQEEMLMVFGDFDPSAYEDKVTVRWGETDAWFYPCSREMHARLDQMYVADPRFAATYEKIRPGMAAYVRDASAANASRPAS